MDLQKIRIKNGLSLSARRDLVANSWRQIQEFCSGEDFKILNAVAYSLTSDELNYLAQNRAKQKGRYDKFFNFPRRVKGGGNMEFEIYLNSYNELFAKVGDKDVALFILDQVAKDRRTAEINGNGGGKSGQEPATQNQIGYLKRLRVEVKPGINKAEASRLIDEKMKK